MALSITLRASTVTTGNSSAYTAGPSYQPSSNSLLLACIGSPASTAAPTRSVTGHGVTWTQIATLGVGSSDAMCVYAAAAGATPTTALLTAQWTAGRTGASIFELEITGQDGASTAAIAQIGSTVVTSSNPTIVVNAPASASNRPVLFAYRLANEAISSRAGWDELADAGHSSPVRRGQIQVKTDGFESTASAQAATNVASGLIALEIRAAGSTYSIAADSGSVSLTGTDAALIAQRRITADGGSVSLAGTDATFALTRRLVAESASITLTGTDATLTHTATVPGSYSLTAESGSVVLVGTNAVLQPIRRRRSWRRLRFRGGV